MASRADVLDRVKELVASARELSAQPPNPFDQVGATPALDALKLNGAVISDADLTALLGAVEKAKHDDETWAKIAGTVGALLGGLAKAALSMLVAFLTLGCSTPPPIQRASVVERQALEAFKQDHDAIVKALFDDLALAFETQIRLIEDYEIKAKGNAVAQADLMALLSQARKKREETAAKLDALRAKVKSADRNFEIALQIHDAIDGFLNRKSFGMDDVAGLLGQVAGLKDGLAK